MITGEWLHSERRQYTDHTFSDDHKGCLWYFPFSSVLSKNQYRYKTTCGPTTKKTQQAFGYHRMHADKNHNPQHLDKPAILIPILFSLGPPTTYDRLIYFLLIQTTESGSSASATFCFQWLHMIIQHHMGGSVYESLY